MSEDIASLFCSNCISEWRLRCFLLYDINFCMENSSQILLLETVTYTLSRKGEGC